MSDADCPRCGTHVAAGQEYCIECGLRLSRRSLPPMGSGGRIAALLAAGIVAAAGAAVAIAVNWDGASDPTVITATGGSLVPATSTTQDDLTTWPPARDGWTVVLVSIPKKDGRAAAVAQATQASDRGLPDVGVLDSSRAPSLHPGYWVVFSGIYASEPEATSALLPARAVARGADARRIAPLQR